MKKFPNMDNLREVVRFIEDQREIAKKCGLQSDNFGMFALLTSSWRLSKKDELKLQEILDLK